MLVSGLLDLVLAVILLAGLPGTAMWALGVLLVSHDSLAVRRCSPCPCGALTRAVSGL